MTIDAPGLPDIPSVMSLLPKRPGCAGLAGLVVMAVGAEAAKVELGVVAKTVAGHADVGDVVDLDGRPPAVDAKSAVHLETDLSFVSPVLAVVDHVRNDNTKVCRVNSVPLDLELKG